MKKFNLLICFIFALGQAMGQNAWINEFHYDNSSTDQDEFVEIVIENPGSYTLSDFQLDLYNGGTGTSYDNKTLDQFTEGTSYGNFTVYYYVYPTNGIQNGAPDGLALSYQGNVISGQFLSYEGSFDATDGPANGLTSTDIGVSETTSTPVGESLQLSGSGTQYSDFTWQSPAADTKGIENTGQTLSTGGVENPVNFSASASTTTQIDLSWMQNSNSNNVMVAYSSDGTFGTPTDGTSYASGDGITGGGKVIFNGNATSYDHTSLTQGTQYYYKAWSMDGSSVYSGGVTSDATTYKSEPTNQVSSFVAGTPTATTVPLTWNDNDGAVAADKYLIMANTSGTFTAPVDETAQADDKDMSDGSGQVNIAHGTETYTFTGLYPGHTYYFKIWAYTNSGSAINYKTDGTVPTANAAISAANTKLIISEVADPGDNTNARYVELFNPGNQAIDFGTTDWYLVKQVNGGTMYPVHLSGSIAPSGTYVVADNLSDFNSAYGFDPDQHNGNINGNGDDGYYLYYGGDENTGTLIDSYGVVGEDGSGKAWEYTDSKAARKSTITSPNASWTASEWDIASAAVTDLTPGTYGNCITWNGASSADWGTAGNWEGGITPASASVVKIPSGVVNNAEVNESISSPATCSTLIINSGATFTINPGMALTVSGDLTNNGTLTLAGDASENGSLIVYGTPGGDVTAQHYIKAYTSGTDNGWHFIGLMVDASISGTDFEPGANDDLFDWSEENDLWINWKDAVDGHFNFERGLGALIAKATATSCAVTGPLKNSDVTFNDLSYTPAKGTGWQLLGNPFTSAITWGGPNWALSNVNGVAKIWNSSAGNYTDLNEGSIIPAFDGFFVQVSSSTNAITIPAANRVHNAAGNNFKSALVSNQNDALQLKVTDDSNSYYDINILGFKSDASQDFDPALDSHKLFSFVKTSPQLWTVSNEQNFSTNYIPLPDESISIPLDFKAGIDGTYHLSWSGIHNMNKNLKFLLEDRQADTTLNMYDVSGYDFDADTTDNPGRFFLHINSTTGTLNKNADDRILVYGQKSDLYIKAKDNSMLSGILVVHNLVGQMVYRVTLNGTKQQILHTRLKTGLYIVHIELKDGTKYTQKIAIL